MAIASFGWVWRASARSVAGGGNITLESGGIVMTFLETIFVSGVTAGGIAFSVLKFLGQRFLDHKLGKDIEQYKTELGEKTEALKTQLSIYSHEQAVEFSRVDSQSAAAISEVYAGIRAIVNPLSQLIAGSHFINGTERQSLDYYLNSAESAHEANKLLADILANHAIYFDNLTYTKIANFVEASSRAVAIYLRPLRMGIADGKSNMEILALAENGRESLSATHGEVLTPQIQELVAIFRINLGIER
jgi:hypothetical protein